MHHLKASWLAWGLCALVVGPGAVGLALTLADPNTPRFAPALVETTLNSLHSVVFGIVAALIVAHQPRNTIGWLLMVLALGVTTAGVAVSYLPLAMAATPHPTLAILLIAWFNNWSWWLLLGPLLLILLLFPTGRPPSPRWRWVIVAVAVLFGIFLLVATLKASFEVPNTNVRLRNPLGILPESVWTIVAVPWIIVLLTTITFCVAAVFVRYRRAAAQERAQIKWFLYACALLLIILAISSFQQIFATSFGVWFDILFELALLLIPTSIGIAILRYRLYDIDIIIRRTLIYSMLTVTLGLVYVGCIVVSRTLVAPLIGSSDVAIVASTLAIAALFTPLRRRIQNVIDKRFYRRKYDAAKVLAAFGATARDETDLDNLTGELLRVVDETMQPEFVGLWLRDVQPHSTTDGARPASISPQ